MTQEKKVRELHIQLDEQLFSHLRNAAFAQQKSLRKYIEEMLRKEFYPSLHE